MTKEKRTEKFNLFIAFKKASEISVSLVSIPILFLLVGVVLDKKLDTIPLFILSGVVLGVIFSIYKALSLERKLKQNG